MHEGGLPTAVIKQALHRQTEPDTCTSLRLGKQQKALKHNKHGKHFQSLFASIVTSMLLTQVGNPACLGMRLLCALKCKSNLLY